MKLNRLGLLIGFFLGTFVIILLARPAQAGCNVNCWNKDCAKDYGYGAVNEPYLVTHAEWIDDDQRTWVSEGVDCSGLVNKTWGLRDAAGSLDLYWWFTKEPLRDGGYSAAGFYDSCSGTGACTFRCTGGTCPQNLTDIMDAILIDIPSKEGSHLKIPPHILLQEPHIHKNCPGA